MTKLVGTKKMRGRQGWRLWEKVRSCFLSGARSLLHSSPSPLSFVTPADAQPVHLSSPPLAVSGTTHASDKYLRAFKTEMKEGWTGFSLLCVMLSCRERCSRAEHADSMAPRWGASVAGLRPAGKIPFSNEGGMANFSPALPPAQLHKAACPTDQSNKQISVSVGRASAFNSSNTTTLWHASHRV